MFSAEAYHKLQEHIKPLILPDLKLETRIHPLNRYIASAPGRNIFIKRDDELSSGITGSKYRKYASLLQHLLSNSYNEALLIGSAQSNNIAGLAQMLNGYQLHYRLMLLESNEAILRGNLLWANMLYDMRNVLWVKRDDWPRVNDLAREYADSPDKNVFVVKEGCAVPEALPGAMTLALDIIYNSVSDNIPFEHIFIDSGSGTTAIGLLLGLALVSVKDVNLHITLMAGTEVEFRQQLELLKSQYEQQHTIQIDASKISLHFHTPVFSPSFGSITTKVLDEVVHLARTEGILADPVYTAKHFATAKDIIERDQLKGNILLVHSGGALGLSGFQEKLAKLLLNEGQGIS